MIEPGTCPNCGKESIGSRHVSGSDRQPNPGDVSVCADCGGLSVYRPDGGRRYPTPTEATDIAADPMILVSVGAMMLSISVARGQMKTMEN